MKKNLLLLVFCVLSCSISLWFIGKTGAALVRYAQFSTHVPISIEKWEISEKGPNRFVLSASYSYDYLGKKYVNVGALGKEFPNPWAIEKAKLRLLEQKWIAWINPKKPSFSVLEKKMPLKSLLSSLVMLGVMGYFIGLIFYMRKHDGSS